MIVLGIETSCDDTSAAVYDGSHLLSNIISTQMIHRNFGGVVPELASRSHISLLIPVIRQAIERAGISKADLQGIAVTCGPGLAGSLLTGLSAAKGMALGLGIPFIGVNHLEGHIWGNLIEHPDLSFPAIVLVVSGGHTQLVHVASPGTYKVLGRTRDDAAGEAFDKVAKLLDLGFPGGPVIEQLAKKGDASRFAFPRAYLDEGSLDFSFSGLKTAVLNHVEKVGPDQTRFALNDIAAGFQQAILDVLIDKTLLAAKKLNVETVCLAGGVASNATLQSQILMRGESQGVRAFWPSQPLCSDNAGMIARAGHFYLMQGQRSPLSLSPSPSLNL